MKVAIKAGAEIDVLTPAEFKAEMARVERSIQDALSQTPLVRTIEAQTILSAAGAGTIRLELPPLADSWDVRRINVTYEDATAALVATTVTIFRGNVVNPLNFVDRNSGTSQVPAVSTWNSREFTLRQDEPMLLVVTGGTASAPIFASAQVIAADWKVISQPGLS